MANLLIVTDHRFYSFSREIYDNYVFNYAFFNDYLKVFENVTIAARVIHLNEMSTSVFKSTGPNVSFIALDDVRGAQWILKNGKFVKKAKIDLNVFDAICFRIPSMLCFSVWRLNNRTANLPYMFEFIGDPKEALIYNSNSVLKKIVMNLLGSVIHVRMNKIVENACTGSYVSFRHLQKKFPVKNGVLTETISSIRLNEALILENLVPLTKIEKLQIVHVGSFVAVKNQKVLIEVASLLKNTTFAFHITFLGSGDLLEGCKEYAERLGVAGNISFLGHVSGIDNIVQYLDRNNIFILPSFSEGMPRALIEAMARGLICFGAKRGGIAELLDSDFTFDPKNSSDIFELLVKTIGNIDKVNRSRVKNLDLARTFVQTELSSKRIRILDQLKKHTH